MEYLACATLEKLACATLEELAKSIDDTEQQDHVPPLNKGYKEDIVVLFYDLFDKLDGEDSSNSDKAEEHKEENMSDQYLDWMAQGPLGLMGNLHKIPRHPKNILSKYNLEKKTKAEDHLVDFYMYLRMLEVRYDDVACKIFPYTLEDRISMWYRSLLVN